MGRIFGIGAVMFGAMALAGCGAQPEQAAGPRENASEAWEQAAERGETMGTPQEGWLSDIAAGKTLECEYRMADGDGEYGTVRMIMDRDRYRTETRTENGEFISVFDGETSYSWTAGEGRGMKMRMDCVEGMDDADMEADMDEEMSDEESFRSSEEALNLIPDISCREIDSANFSVPEDVEFVDQCEMLREQTRMMEQYQDMMPEDAMKMMQGMGE